MKTSTDKLLIPVDLSKLSRLACKVGFELAGRLKLKPVILHVYTAPFLMNTAPDEPFPSLDDNENALENMELAQDARTIAQDDFKRFIVRLNSDIQQGIIKNLPYDTELSEGTPEEVILEYTRLTPPVMVVMATRGKKKRDMELVGSVTAEVLDSCRVPVFSVPENYSFPSLEDIRKLAFFCNLDGKDEQSVEFFMGMFDCPEVDVMLVPASKKIQDSDSKINQLKEALISKYPKATFEVASFPVKEFRTEFEAILERFGLEMLIVPNKRMNIFTRLFNPGIPHRVLFERDIPMLALPV